MSSNKESSHYTAEEETIQADRPENEASLINHPERGRRKRAEGIFRPRGRPRKVNRPATTTVMIEKKVMDELVRPHAIGNRTAGDVIKRALEREQEYPAIINKLEESNARLFRVSEQRKEELFAYKQRFGELSDYTIVNIVEEAKKIASRPVPAKPLPF